MSSCNRIGHTSFRVIPEAWPSRRTLGRTDVSLDCLTDARCRQVVYAKTNCWTIRISTAELARVLPYAFRDGTSITIPFTIDVGAGTVNGLPVAIDTMEPKPQAA